MSDEAYEKLIEYGVPVQKYVNEERDPETGRYRKEPKNDGEVIFDNELTSPDEGIMGKVYHKYKNTGSRLTYRYWDSWTRENRTHPLVIKVIEELGSEAASGGFGKLAIVEVPDDVEWEIEEYDGFESVREKSRSWG